MTRLRHEIFIAAPVDPVWAALADLTAVPRYNPTVRRATVVGSIAAGVGAERVCELNPKGQVRERVTVWASNSSRATGPSPL